MSHKTDMDWLDFKHWLEGASGLEMDALHIHAGVLGLFAVALLTRRPVASWLPWIAVLIAALANEIYDLRYDPWPETERARQIAESVKDVWNTMLLPTVIALLAQFLPKLFAGRAAKASAGSDQQ